MCVRSKFWIRRHPLLHSLIVSERCWADSRWPTFLEPGPLLEHTIQCIDDNDGKQVDDDGESYWIFESRDVGCLSFTLIFYNLEHALRAKAFAACQSYRLSVSALLRILGISYSEFTLPLRLFWTALYVFPALWLGLFFVSLLKFNLSLVKSDSCPL